MSTIEQATGAFRPITLEEMSSVRLMNRTDTKFVTSCSLLVELLRMAPESYMMQETRGGRTMEYESIYLDTAEFAMYYEHMHGHSGRQKIRMRTYLDSGQHFLEIKTKNNHGRTKKKRIEVEQLQMDDPKQRAFTLSHLRHDPQELRPHLKARFRRMTLVNMGMTERLTIDTDLTFTNLQTGLTRNMGELAIIELKRDGLQRSAATEMLRQLRIHAHGFSKYCIGAALTNGELRQGRLKPKLHYAEKIMGTHIL